MQFNDTTRAFVGNHSSLGLTGYSFSPQPLIEPLRVRSKFPGTEKPSMQLLEGAEQAYGAFDSPFHQASRLLYHRKRTTSPRSNLLRPHIFECEHPACTKGFKSRNNMRRHLKGHLQENKYVCGIPDCRHTFSRSDSLQRHHNRAHGIEGIFATTSLPRL